MVPEGAGDRIRRYRRLRGLSQQQLADLAETDKGYISRLEAGRIEAPGVDVFKRIAQALNAPLRALAEPLGWYDDDEQGSGDWEAAIMADPRFADKDKQALVHILKGLLPNTD